MIWGKSHTWLKKVKSEWTTVKVYTVKDSIAVDLSALAGSWELATQPQAWSGTGNRVGPKAIKVHIQWDASSVRATSPKPPQIAPPTGGPDIQTQKLVGAFPSKPLHWEIFNFSKRTGLRKVSHCHISTGDLHRLPPQVPFLHINRKESKAVWCKDGSLRRGVGLLGKVKTIIWVAKLLKIPTKRATTACDSMDVSGIHRCHRMKPVLMFLSCSFGFWLHILCTLCLSKWLPFSQRNQYLSLLKTKFASPTKMWCFFFLLREMIIIHGSLEN